jgi:bifunctional non-homologous end joining protein LigD
MKRRIHSCPDTSGGRGLHVLVPLRRGPTQDEVRAFALEVGPVMAARAPGSSRRRRLERSAGARPSSMCRRNTFGQTIGAPRTRCAGDRRPPISTPLAWEEVEAKLDPARYNLWKRDRRLAGPEPWADFWARRQSLPELR